MLNLKNFIGKNQLAALRSCLQGEERAYFVAKIGEIKDTIGAMPKPYETEGQEAPSAALHYFSASHDWWIIERDSEPDQLQAFGIACLNGDGEMAEFGYINIKELIGNPSVEIDLYYTPEKAAEIMARLKR